MLPLSLLHHHHNRFDEGAIKIHDTMVSFKLFHELLYFNFCDLMLQCCSICIHHAVCYI
jgi:hypothetical protein